jgi:hypothetical protein
MAKQQNWSKNRKNSRPFKEGKEWKSKTQAGISVKLNRVLRGKKVENFSFFPYFLRNQTKRNKPSLIHVFKQHNVK